MAMDFTIRTNMTLSGEIKIDYEVNETFRW